MMTPAVRVHGAVLVPFSNPGLPMSCCAAAELMVREMVVVCVRLPETPVTVILLVPVVAVLAAVNVSTLVEVVGLVPKLAVTPLGKADVDRVTDPVKPLRSVSVIVLLPLVPCFTVKLLGEADKEKSGCAGAFTVRLMVVVWVSDPETPVTVTVAGPVVAVELALSVRTLLDVVGLVPNVAVTPAGNPDAESVTDPVNPFSGFTVMVLLPLLPCVTVNEAGEADNVKSGVAVPPQPANLKFAMRVLQLNVPLALRYSVVYQNVQSSTGSTEMAL